tara:strand:+ start:491 stop:634 length:144 start_codon:yes stop_codon:yes gene_type:complete
MKSDIEMAENEIRQAQQRIRVLQDELDKQTEIIRLAHERKIKLEEKK